MKGEIRFCALEGEDTHEAFNSDEPWRNTVFIEAMIKPLTPQHHPSRGVTVTELVCKRHVLTTPSARPTHGMGRDTPANKHAAASSV